MLTIFYCVLLHSVVFLDLELEEEFLEIDGSPKIIFLLLLSICCHITCVKLTLSTQGT